MIERGIGHVVAGTMHDTDGCDGSHRQHICLEPTHRLGAFSAQYLSACFSGAFNALLGYTAILLQAGSLFKGMTGRRQQSTPR